MAKKDVSKNWKGRQIFLCNEYGNHIVSSRFILFYSKFIFGGKNSVKEVVFSYGTLIVSAGKTFSIFAIDHLNCVNIIVLYYCFSGLYVAREVTIGVNIMRKYSRND